MQKRQNTSTCSLVPSRKGAYGNTHFSKRHQKSQKGKGYNNTIILMKSKPKHTQKKKKSTSTEQVTPSTWTRAKHLTLIHKTSLSLIWRDLMDGPLGG